MRSILFPLSLSFLCLSLISTSYMNKVCHVDSFSVWPLVHRDGPTVQVTSYNVHITACLRACRLYTECVGFNVIWTNITLQTGYCMILASKTNWIQPIVINNDLAFYEKNYRGRNVALRDYGTTCTASTDDVSCYKAVNGNLEDRWSSRTEDNKQWILLQLNGSYTIKRIDIYHRCRYRTQCSEVTLKFSDGTMIKRPRQCNGDPDAEDCTYVPVEFYYIDMIATTSIKFLCSGRCDDTNGYIGFREILIWNTDKD